MTRAALDKAAELWAAVRNAGVTTAPAAALDGNAILAAQATLAADAGDVLTIATINPRHLSRFSGIDARPWQSIAP
jgi:toxin FitB